MVGLSWEKPVIELEIRSYSELGIRSYSELGIRSVELGVNSTFKTPHSSFFLIPHSKLHIPNCKNSKFNKSNYEIQQNEVENASGGGQKKPFPGWEKPILGGKKAYF